MLFGIMVVPVGAENTEGYFTYYVTPEKEAIIVSVNPQISGDVVVPSETNDGYRVIGIGERAFNACHGIKSITIGSSVEEIDSTAFMLSDNIESITVLPGNKYYSSENGILFDVNKTAIISYPCGKAGGYVIPNYVTEIGDWAFYHCGRLTSVTNTDSVSVIGVEAFSYCVSLVNVSIPNGVEVIQGATFAGCFNLTSIEIPASVRRIEQYAFFECEKLTDVYYRGSEAEWNSIDIEDQDNDFLKNANKHYNGIGGGSSTGSTTGGGGGVSPSYGGGIDERWTDGVVVNENNLDIEDLKYRYIAGADEYNPNSIGMINIDFMVTDSTTNKAGAVRICSWWSGMYPSQQEIASSRDLTMSMWKQDTIYTQTAPYRNGGYFPIHSDDLGKTLYVLLVGLDENADWAGEVLIRVDVPDGQGEITPVEPEKIQQDITVAIPREAVYGDGIVNINAFPTTATSGLYGFEFKSSNTDVAEIEAREGSAGTYYVAVIKSTGTTQITVKQAGNDEFAPFEYTQTLVVLPKQISVISLDIDNETAELDGILEADKDGVELDFDKLDKTFNEFEEIETVKKAKMTVKNFVLKGNKAKNYFVATTDSITAYAEIDEVDNENIETTEGVTADIVKTSDTAIISNVDISAIGGDEENIIFDLTKDANISAVSIAATALQEAVTAEKGYGFKAMDKNNKEVILVFDKDALSAISEDVTGNISVKIANPELEDTALAGDKQTELNGKSAKVYDLSLENANTTDFGEGTAIVALYYEKPAINGNVVAGYIKDDGTIETVPSVYDDTTKTIILALSHFSDYVIYTEPVIHHSSGGGGGTTSYTVKFDTNGGDALKNISVQQGQAIGTIQTPQKKGFIFDGWYSDKELTKSYSADEKVTASTTLFAGWKIDPIRQMTLTIGDKNATVFGEETANDVAPIIRNDRTMLPIRFIAEALGAEVSWDGENKIVTITSDDTEIKITIDKGVAIVNGEEIVLDSPAFIESDRTFLPLRFVSENLGAEVDWVEETRQVVITKAIED